MKLSVIIPVYNESAYLESVVQRILRQPLGRVDYLEIIIVDDGSCDGTTDIIAELSKIYPKGPIKVVYHEKNLGKGAALTRIFHSAMNQRSGESVKRLDITQPNENATHRFFDDRL